MSLAPTSDSPSEFGHPHADLCVATAARCGDIDWLRIALARGGDPNARDEHSRPACAGAIQYGHVDCLRELARAGADLRAPHSTGSPLIWAARWGQMECLAIILASGAGIDSREAKTAALIAREAGRRAAAELLEAAALAQSESHALAEAIAPDLEASRGRPPRM